MEERKPRRTTELSSTRRIFIAIRPSHIASTSLRNRPNPAIQATMYLKPAAFESLQLAKRTQPFQFSGVGRTLLSATVDVDFDLDPDPDAHFIHLTPHSPGRSNTEWKIFQAEPTSIGNIKAKRKSGPTRVSALHVFRIGSAYNLIVATKPRFSVSNRLIRAASRIP
jgi:hypothetical protein